MDQLDLSDFFKTKAQANDFSARLSEINKDLYQTNFVLENALLQQYGMKKRDTFMRILRESNISTTSVDALRDFFAKIQQQIPTLQVLSMTMPFEPQEATLKVLSDWFLVNVKRQILLDIAIDPRLIAGISLQSKGTFFDFSIRRRFAQILDEVLSNTDKADRQPKESPSPAPEKHKSAESISIGR